MTFWDRLVNLMEIHKMSQTELAKKLEVSPSYISVSMIRNTIPRGDFLIKVSNCFHVTPRWLMTGEDKEGINPKYAVVVENDKVLELAYSLLNVHEDTFKAIESLVSAIVRNQRPIC